DQFGGLLLFAVIYRGAKGVIQGEVGRGHQGAGGRHADDPNRSNLTAFGCCRSLREILRRMGRSIGLQQRRTSRQPGQSLRPCNSRSQTYREERPRITDRQYLREDQTMTAAM